MCRDSVCTVQSAMLHYFLCVLLNLFMPELAPPVIRARSAALPRRAEPGLHSSLPVCCHLTPSTTNLIQQHGDKRDREGERGWKERADRGGHQMGQTRQRGRRKDRKRDSEWKKQGSNWEWTILKIQAARTADKASFRRIHLKSLIVCSSC